MEGTSTSSIKEFQALKEKLEVHKTGGVVGIDIAKAKHFAVILDPVGQTIQPPFAFPNDRAGFEHLIDRVDQLAARHLINHWVFGFEASGGYEKTLAAFLAEKGHDVVQVSSYAAKRQRELMTGSVDKNDAKDCVVFAVLSKREPYQEAFATTEVR